MTWIDDLRVKDVFSASPIVLNEEQSLSEAYEALVGEAISGVPVTDVEGDLIGVVSASDLLVALAPLLDSQEETPDAKSLIELKDAPLSEHVQGPPLTCEERTTLREACQLMVRERVHRLVVVAADEIVGVISSMDVVRAVARGTEAEEA